MLAERGLQQSFLTEAQPPAIADDDMVVQHDRQCLDRRLDLPGHQDVVARGRRVSAWMVMQQSSFGNHSIENKGLFGIRRNRWGMDLGSVLSNRA